MADDPAYAQEYDELADLCRAFLEAHERGDFETKTLITGMLTAQCAVLWLLSPPGGLLDPATLFAREGQQILRVPA